MTTTTCMDGHSFVFAPLSQHIENRAHDKRAGATRTYCDPTGLDWAPGPAGPRHVIDVQLHHVDGVVVELDDPHHVDGVGLLCGGLCQRIDCAC